MASDTDRNKRRKTSADTHVGISNLPDGLLADVASYLAKSSRAFFAVAMTAPSASWREDSQCIRRPSEAADAILSSAQWDKLDFGDIEKFLAEKLTDDDVHSILLSINAKTTLKILKLTGCINITGTGLGPLRDSVVVRQIDLSLVGYHESPYLESEPEISEVAILPILGSIIDNPINSLKHIQLPVKWREEHSLELGQLLEKYHQMMENRRLCCSQCDDVIQYDLEWRRKWYFYINRRFYGVQNQTCCKCMKHFCTQHDPLVLCTTCRRAYCQSCLPEFEICDVNRCPMGICKECRGELTECEGCEANVCELCLNTCENCNNILCDDCSPFVECDGKGCTKAHCEDCFDGKDYDVSCCDDCARAFCLDCRYLELKKDLEHACSGCLKEFWLEK